MTKQIIMTSPVSFGVEYEINPWMVDNAGKIDKLKAVQQWAELWNTLSALGVDVVVTPPPPKNCPDAVFTANAGLIYRGKFFPSKFRHLERSYEENYFINWMMKSLVVDETTVLGARELASFEGGGDALFDQNNNLWLGTGYRTSMAYKFFLDKFFEDTDVIVRALELTDPRFYHLDTCFCPLDTGEVIWYPPAFSEYSQYVIEGMFKGKLISVSEDDAVRFACNAISVGQNIVLPLVSDSLVKELKSKGYSVFQKEMSEFLKSGGACKCLTLEVNE